MSIKLENAIEEARNYFTDEQELEVMQETDSDVNFEVGFYKGLLEAKSIVKDEIDLLSSDKEILVDYVEILWEYISDKNTPEIISRYKELRGAK
jgi:hypothetical protein